MRVTIFTGSTPGNNPAFTKGAAHLATFLAEHNIGVVYGGGNVGLMGVVADAAMAAGGEVIGIIPEALVVHELAHDGLTHIEIVDSMHTRKARMAELGDAFVVLPGSIGTLEEFFEVWTWQQLGIHDKPVVVYDIDGYWQPLRDLIDNAVDSGFMKPPFRDALLHVNSPEQLLEELQQWQQPLRKWEDGLHPKES